jgi:hypothetical protein
MDHFGDRLKHMHNRICRLLNLVDPWRVRQKPFQKAAVVGLMVGMLAAIAGLTIPAEPEQLPIFDTHVHYNENSWNHYSPGQIIGKIKAAGVMRALVSSSPDDGTRKLYELDPQRIVPFLRPYHDDVTSGDWFDEQHDILTYLENRLETPIYSGIGEIHLHFDGTAEEPIVRKTSRLAVARNLYLHVHSNAAEVRTIFENEPDIKILWAHAGLTEPPQTVARMLGTYQRLWVDISIRESEIAPGGILDPAWRDLFIRHPDRITVGSDTWVPQRWDEYGRILDFDRHWLGQLPESVAVKIAYANAVKLFEASPRQAKRRFQ